VRTDDRQLSASKSTDRDGAGGEFTVKSPPAIEKEQQQPTVTKKERHGKSPDWCIWKGVYGFTTQPDRSWRDKTSFLLLLAPFWPIFESDN